MINALTTISNESALDKRDYITGIYPPKRNSTRAEILANLLDGHTLKAMDGVRAQSTTRLPAVIHVLGDKYDWPISRRDAVEGTKDGRICYVTEYWLDQDVIAAAFEQGARKWILSVRTAREHLRTRARRCKAIAERANARRGLVAAKRITARQEAINQKKDKLRGRKC